ncbi:MAG: hypothetical protein D6688_03500 [Alphaproteobacteria bacterium]|nr:MAG: hypothetical protein D6688_03500 [Alphaproteobacteria bacterium]
MTRIERDGDGFVVPAPLLAEAFGLDEAAVKAALRRGAMTSRCETGVDEDAGRWRLTFRFRDRALSLIVDAEGEILGQARFPVTPARRRSAVGQGVTH